MKRGGYIARRRPEPKRDEAGKIIWSSLPRKSGLRFRPRRAPKRTGTRRDDSPYRRFVRSLPCIAHDIDGVRLAAGPCRGPVQAAHVVVRAGDRGIALKAHDRQCVPLCARHHRDFDTNAGLWKGWTKEQKRDLAAQWVWTVQLLATPEDHETALLYEELGLGRIVRGADGLWSWKEGQAEESEAAA